MSVALQGFQPETSAKVNEIVNLDEETVEADEAAGAGTEENTEPKRTFFGSTLCDLIPVLGLLVIALGIAGFLAVTEIQFAIADAEMHRKALENYRLYQEALAGVEKP